MYTYYVLTFNYVLHLQPYNLIYACLYTLHLNSSLSFNAILLQTFNTCCVLIFNYVLLIRPYNFIYTCMNILSLNSTLTFTPSCFRTPSCFFVRIPSSGAILFLRPGRGWSSSLIHTNGPGRPWPIFSNFEKNLHAGKGGGWAWKF